MHNHTSYSAHQLSGIFSKNVTFYQYCLFTTCPHCGETMWFIAHNWWQVTKKMRCHACGTVHKHKS